MAAPSGRNPHMGTIISTVGSAGGRDFATLDDWFNALPSNLVTDGNSYVADLYNDSEFQLSSYLLMSGITTDATHTLTIKAADGQGWNHNGSVPTVYNPSQGVAISCSSPITSYMLRFFTNYVTLKDIQFLCDEGGAIQVANDGQIVDISGCLIETTTSSTSGSSAAAIVYLDRANASAGSASFSNNVIVSRNGLNDLRIDNVSGFTDSVYFNTIVCSNAGSNYGLDIEAVGGGGGVINFANNAVFGFTNEAVHQGGTVTFNSNNNATDLSSLSGTDNLTDLTFADQFVNVDDAVRDYRVSTASLSKAITVTIYASSLVGAGTSSGSIGADVFGVSRPTIDEVTYDIGATEIS